MIVIDHADLSERAEIIQFMQDSFPRAKWSRAGWEALLSRRWSTPEDSYAITVRDAGVLVGVLGLVAGTRQTPVGQFRTSNMTSWYVNKTHRGQGLGSKMLKLVTADPDITVTNFSSARGAIPVVERAGFTALDSRRSIWRNSGGPARLTVHEAPLLLGDALTETDRRVLNDHAGLNLKTVAVETADGPCVLVLAVKQKTDAYVSHEVMYLGDRDRFATHARAIADSLLPAENAVLSVDQRFVAPGCVPDADEAIAVPRFYTPGRMRPQDVDHLYSEIVLLDLKMY